MIHMDMEQVIQFNKAVKFQIGKKKTLVGNTDNAECLFISNECMDILLQAEKERMKFGHLLSSIEDTDSRNYMKKLMEKMDKLNMWKNSHSIYSKKPLHISFDITNDCNLRCKHCCVSAGDKARGRELSTEELLDAAERITGAEPATLVLSGGEPLVRSDFKQVTLYIKQHYKGNLSIMTNGTLIDDNMAEFIATNYDQADVSLDGVDEETCSKLRGQGVFEKAVEGIRKLKKHGCGRITASMLVTRETKPFISDFKKFCKEVLLIDGIIRGFDEAGRGIENAEQIKVKEEEDADFEKAAKAFRENKLYKLKPQIFACQGTKKEFQIDHKGNIYPCASLMEDEFLLGNIFEIDDLGKFLRERKFQSSEGYKNFESYLPYNMEGCRDCNKNLLCFSCVNQARKARKQKGFLKLCEENKCYFDLYWRDYGTI